MQTKSYEFKKMNRKGQITLFLILGIVLVIRDISREQKLAKLRTDFVSNVTHELKTPVATVSVVIEALRNFQGVNNPQLTKEYLEIAQFELDRLTRMTDNILRTSILEEEEDELAKEVVDVDVLVEQVFTSMKIRFEKEGAIVRYQKEGSDFNLLGNEIHLTNLIHNLIDNALKYSYENPQINVLLTDSTDELTLTVTDKGIGIDAQYHHQIFEKFFRVPTGDVHNTKGYGLGLNYVASVVKGHDGEIAVRSELKNGTTFIITFPKDLE